MKEQDNILRIGVEEHLGAFVAAAPEERRAADAFARDADELFQAIDDYDAASGAARSAVTNDRNLSEVGREEKLREALQPLQGALRERLEQRTEAVLGRISEQEQRHAFTPPPLETDAAVSEARLANARSDARMLLDAAGSRAPDMMRQLVEGNTDPAVTHLLMHTNWPSLYLQSRGASSAVWDAHREALMPKVLPEDLAAKYRASKAVTHLRQAAELIKATKHFALADRGLK